MRLYELLEECTYRDVLNPKDVEIKGVTYDSKSVKRDFIFVALPGTRKDGKRFIPEAVEKGAAAVAGDAPVDIKIPLVIVENPRRFLAEVSWRFYGHPEKELRVIGITGTNGKTTTSYLLKSVLEEGNNKTGLIGTIRYFNGKEWIDMPPNTTPESSIIASLFSKMVKNRVKFCVMEVSSHALALDRIFGVEFDAAIFTNIGKDHLDFHGTMEEYIKAKLKLFRGLKKGFAVLNKDDRFFQRFAEASRAEKITYGVSKRADIMIRIKNMDMEGMHGEITYRKKIFPFKTSLIGFHNAYNIASVFATGVGFGIDEERILKGIEKVKEVPGRMERIKAENGGYVVIDYAHTPEALKNVLLSLKKITKKRIITVFGCGGDRDKEKRPKMGEIASLYSHHVIITNDNPRTEDPNKIIEDILKGVKRSHEVILDRHKAIFKAVSMLEKNDVVLIAGKGHEKYQIINDKKIPFDDKETAVEAIRVIGK